MTTDRPALELRITRIEAQLRRARLLAFAASGLVLILLATGYRNSPRDVVQAERLELVGAQGARQAVLSADSAGFAVTLIGRDDTPTAILRLTGEPRLTVETGRGLEVAGLGGPKVRHLTE